MYICKCLIKNRQLQFGFWQNDPIYLSLGGLVICLANGGTLSELELRLLYMWMYRMYKSCSFLMWHHVEMIYFKVLLFKGWCQVTREQGHRKEPHDSDVLWPWRLWPLHWDKRNLCLQIICIFKTLISSNVPSGLIIVDQPPPAPHNGQVTDNRETWIMLSPDNSWIGQQLREVINCDVLDTF